MSSKTKPSNKKLEKVINQVPANYYDRGVKNNWLQKYWHGRKWQTLGEFLEGLSGKLLDVGCADGTTTYQVFKMFPKLKITGLDYYKKTIDFARKTRPRINFIVGDAHRLPFRNKTFDVVMTVEVLEHLDNPRKALSEIYRVLKDDGSLVIGQDTNSLLFRFVWWLWTKWKGSVWQNSHINCVSGQELIELVKKERFDIEKVKYINLNMEIFIKAHKR